MHPCLQVYDILECICSHLQEPSSLDALAKLARTCRMFLDPALSALWHTIPTLTPLIKCLPEDAWAIKSTRYYSMLTLTRKTTRKDWERCTFYAHRIRQFGSIELDRLPPGMIKGSIPTDKTVYMALKPSYGNNNRKNPPLLLPKLRSCRLVPHISAPAPHWSAFLTHTLRTLELRAPTYDPEETLPRILRSIGKASPLLQSLKINGLSPTLDFEPACVGTGEGRSGLSNALVQVLFDLDHLESLVCPYIRFPDEGVRYLARKAKIRELHIRNTAKDILEALDHGDWEGECFEFLQRLSVDCSPGGDLEECTRLLKRIFDVSRIEGLEVGRQGHTPTECELRNFIQDLLDLSTPTSSSPICDTSAVNRVNTNLRTLRIHQDTKTDFFSPQYLPRLASICEITLETLSPLLAFPSLKVLNVTLDTPFSISDCDAERMARAWPRLKELRLGFPGSDWGLVLDMTLDGLKIFAKHCKELEVLGVYIKLELKGEADRKRENGIVEEAPVQCRSVRILEVGDLAFDDEPEWVAEYLLTVFPGLHSVLGPNVIVSPEWRKKWARLSLRISELSRQR